MRCRSYVIFILKHAAWLDTVESMLQPRQGSGYATFIREMDLNLDDILPVLQEIKIVIDTLVTDDLVAMLERWQQKCISKKQMRSASKISAHLMYMFKDAGENLNETAVSIIVGNAIFLNANYLTPKWRRKIVDSEASNDSMSSKKGNRAKGDANDSRSFDIGFSDLELIEVYHSRRAQIIDWLNNNSESKNKVLEMVNTI